MHDFKHIQDVKKRTLIQRKDCADFIMTRLQCNDALDILPDHIKNKEEVVKKIFTDNSTNMCQHLADLARVPCMSLERAHQFINMATFNRNFAGTDAYFCEMDAKRAVELAWEEHGYAKAVGWELGKKGGPAQAAERRLSGMGQGRSSHGDGASGHATSATSRRGTQRHNSGEVPLQSTAK